MDGVLVNAMGNITLNKVDAYFNDQNGANLNNNLDGSTGIVTVLNTMGDNTVVGNGGFGLKIQSFGAVTVTGLETIYNSGGGLKVVNTNTIATIKPAITLNSIISRVNSGDGIYTESSGVITINNSWSASNNGDGIGIKSDNNVFHQQHLSDQE